LSSPCATCKRGDLDWVIVRENSEGDTLGKADAPTAVFQKKSARKLRSSRDVA